MTELISQAADALYPLAVLGTGAVATGAAEKVGADLLDAGQRVLARIRFRRAEGEVAPEDLASALEEALAAGVVSTGELEDLVALAGPSEQTTTTNSITGDVTGGSTVIQGGRLTIEGGFQNRINRR